MAFNKAKALQEAERSVAQGKISQAIRLYLEIAQYDPRDLNLLNTIGDLCVRDRNIPEALRVFRKLADAYAREGFVLRAVAIYKKITKLDQNAVDPVIRLAELYLAQGLGREARELYAQALEMCQRTDQREKALEVMRKIVAGEPGNFSHRLRLAEYIEAMGRKTDAAAAYVDAAEVALRQSDRSTANRALAKALELNDTNPRIPDLRDQLAAATAAAPEPASAAKPPGEAHAAVQEPEAALPSPGQPPAETPVPPSSTVAAAAAEPAPSPAAPPLTASGSPAEETVAERAAAFHDVDLSAEWESASAPAGSAEPLAIAEPSTPVEPDAPVEAPPPATAEVSAQPEPSLRPIEVFNYDESRTEIEFYLASGFVDQARAVVAALEAKFPGNTEVQELAKQVEERTRQMPVEEAVADSGRPAEEPTADMTAQSPEPATPMVSEPETAAPSPGEVQPVELQPATEPMSAAPAEHVEAFGEGAPAVTTPEPGLAAGAAAGGDLLQGLSADLEAAWSGLEPEPPAPQSTAEAPSETADVSASLGAMLEELEEQTAETPAQDNPQTHYDLGVAFREMGLLDEAIGEFQKVVKPHEGESPPQFLAACSLLGLCFMDKGMSPIAVKWFERALESPQIDDEATLALQYDLGLAYEQAGNTPKALQRFLEVYSQNIDYREVADKIRLLQQKTG